MTTTQTQKKYPAAVYAAAGAGDLAYHQLRKLPARLTELRERMNTSEREVRVDIERLRAAARRNAAAALDEARTVYADLVARGERVVAAIRTAEREAEETAELEMAAVAEITDKPAAPAKPVKRTRPVAVK
jgi:heparin binding hemagglutinin HbhA